jgi:GntR family transcriptional regulator/MocR family aminotransferase
MPKLLQLELNRRAKTPLAEQIRNSISNAIETGVLASGARLPSWQDLAAQLGVARGTVRSAYEKLSAGQLIVGSPRDRNPCRGSAFNTRSAGPAARSRLVHGNVS